MKNGLNSITNSVKTGGNKIKDIVSALGITKIISTAMNTIMNSIDGAVSRIDTLNNFPKVMTNLGIASEDSEKAINKLSDGLQGIPTKLDEAALAVQRFTSKNGDVDKSVDLFLAVNNALLAGGASAEIQSSAMEQLSQAYAKGKPDMMEWRAIQTAMPAQLKQISQEILGNEESLDLFLKKAKEYAADNPLSSSGAELIEQLEAVKEGAGDMTTALGTALRLGIISMDDFLDTIVKLNKEGTGEFLSLEKQAKNATGGIKTSITNARTAITRGVAKIIEAFDKVLQDNGLGGISEVITNIGKTSEKVLNEIANSLIPKVVSKIKDICNWIKENQGALKNLIAIIGAVTAGYIAYKAVLIAITAIQTVKNIAGTVSAFLSLIPAINSAKDAMTLFNMVSSANPIALVTSAIIAATAAITYFATKQTEAQKVAEETAEKSRELKESYDEFNKSINDATNSDLAQIDAVNRLKDELKTLVDENGRVKKGYESRVDFILNELNKALGTEYKLNDNIIDSYKDLQKEIDETIEKKRAEIILNSEEQKYAEAVEQEKNAIENLKNITDQLGMSYEEAKKKVEDYYSAQKKMLGYGEKLTDDESTVIKDYTDKEIEALNNLVQAYSDTESVLQGSVENQKQYMNDYALFTEGKYNEIGKAITATMQDCTNISLQELSNNINLQKENLDTYKAMYQQYGSEVALELQQQAQSNIEKLAEELVSRTQTINSLGEQEIQAWKTLAESSFAVYSENVSKMAPEMQKKIQEATGVVIANTPEFAKQAGIMGEKVTGEFDKNGQAKQEALKTLQGYYEGLNDKEKNELLKKTVGKKANEVAKQFEEGDYETSGKNVLQGIFKGLSNGTLGQSLINKAAGIAKSIAAQFNIQWDEHSPSKLMEQKTEYLLEPIGTVFEKREAELIRSASNLAKGIVDGFDKSFMSNNIDNLYDRMKSAVETSAINTDVGIKAIIREENRKPRTVTNDNGTVINNTQNFYEKNPTPYEEQKQAKQQLRRLAYGL